MLPAAGIPGLFGRFALSRIVWCCALALLAVLVAPTASPCRAADPSDIELSAPSPFEPIQFGGDEAWRWEVGSYDVWVLRGRAFVQQGTRAAEAREAVLWVKNSSQFEVEDNLVIAYLEGDVRIIDGGADGAKPAELRDSKWYGEFSSTLPINIRAPTPAGQPSVLPQVFVNAKAHRDALLGPSIRRAQFTAQAPAPAAVSSDTFLPGSTAPAAVPGVGGAAPVGGRRLRAFSRTSVKVQVKWMQNPNNAQEWVGIITPGVNLIVDGLDGVGSLDISTDRMIVWTAGTDAPDLSGDRAQGADRPLEIYMEGNIVFREGDRVIYADRMFYDVNRRAGTILQAEILTPVRSYQGLARMKADVVRQIDAQTFQAERAFLTTSRIGDPRYRLQSNRLTFQDLASPEFEPFTGRPVIDPLTGEQSVMHTRQVTSESNLVYLGPVPVFYWPKFSTNLENPQFFLRNIKIKSDRIFGQQILTDWDIYQLMGRRKPTGHDWIASLDYLSERGPAAGTTYSYLGKDLFGFRGGYQGLLDTWGIKDDGLDNLGSDRSALIPEETWRYRLFGRHRQQLPDNFQLSVELGKISDRNFLEQYYELEWDTFKDQTTGIELKHLIDNRSWSIAADVRVNDFFTQTQQLPRFDHYWLGQSLLGDSLTWYEHTSAEYAHLKIFSTPTNPTDAAKQNPLPWELDSQGERFITAQELDLPINLGPVKVVPYAMGQAGHWGEVLDGNETQRLYGQAGVRAALPFWSANPDIQSELLNVNGLAHKVVFDVDAFYADSNRDLNQFPLYDPLDDDAQEHFRRRFAVNTFGGTTPLSFDERFYALRSGLAGNVTNPSAEIADDLQAVRMGVRQRWQTKRGPVANPRIVDWIVLDSEAVWFPDAARDNFGEDLGLARYDFRWHIGERVTLLSDGGFDFFANGQQTVSVGTVLSRPTNGNLYIGYRSLEGPFSSQVLITAASYRLSPKWFGSAALSYDFSGSGTIGNAFSLVRIGESFLTSVNFYYDAYKSNVAATFNIEPRFIPGLARSALRGTTVPPAGMYGLE